MRVELYGCRYRGEFDRSIALERHHHYRFQIAKLSSQPRVDKIGYVLVHGPHVKMFYIDKVVLFRQVHDVLVMVKFCNFGISSSN